MADRNDAAAAQAERDAALYARAMKAFPKSGHLMRPFLEDYELTENQTMSCKNVGVGHDAVAAWKKNEHFMALFTAAHVRAARKNNDGLRSSSLQRAIGGTPEYLVRNGQIVRDERGNPVIVRRTFETQLTIFMLKNRMPDEFRDKFEHEINGQIILTITSEFAAILRKHVPPEVMPQIQKELETLSAKLMGQ